uniref:Farnesyl pyrophosphate synthase n=2 Tax=Meleagris gallopavo TaxID=9103 RepID=A0A803XZ24_MELGA
MLAPKKGLLCNLNHIHLQHISLGLHLSRHPELRDTAGLGDQKCCSSCRESCEQVDANSNNPSLKCHCCESHAELPVTLGLQNQAAPEDFPRLQDGEEVVSPCDPPSTSSSVSSCSDFSLDESPVSVYYRGFSAEGSQSPTEPPSAAPAEDAQLLPGAGDGRDTNLNPAVLQGEEDLIGESPDSLCSSSSLDSQYNATSPGTAVHSTPSDRPSPQVLQYNAPGGKCNRGLTVVAAFRELSGPGQKDAESLRCALAVGWCIELFQAFFLVADDIMDQSLTRRGQLCWYKKEGIGLDAINDAFLLESSVYRMLKKYCGQQPYYVHLLELFLQTAYQTELGQMLDLITAPISKVDLSQFSEERYKAIVKYKTAFYSFYLPVAAAMYMVGIDSKEEHENAKAILLEMGEYFQIQDDYLDCFGDPALTGKVGTDIQDNKCSWLVVQCLQRVTPEQRQLLEENYGRKEPERVAKVKELYETVGMRAAFQQYEESSYRRLQELIEKHSNRLPKEIFLGLARKIYKRQK